jgi:hypothetical protein
MADQKRVSLEGRKLFIGIPAYDGKISIKLAYTLAQLMPKAMSLGVSVQLGHVSGCSIITMARNMLVDQFLQSDCTELLFIDGDVLAQADDILRLMAQGGDKDITAGSYPRRSKDRKFFMELYFDENNELEFDGAMMRINRVGTGFMLIQRHVIEAIAEKSEKYLGQDGIGNVASVFDFKLQDGQFVGEDYSFCDKARDQGFKVWLDVEISLPHVGQEEFTNNFYQEVLTPLMEDMRKAKLKVANG